MCASPQTFSLKSLPNGDKYSLPPLLNGYHSSFIPIPWEWLQAMANQAHSQQNSVHLMYSNVLDEDEMALMVAFPAGVNCISVRGEGNVTTRFCSY